MLCVSCVTLSKFINHSVYFFQYLEIGDDGGANFPKVGERIPRFCMLLPLAGCLAHIKGGFSDRVDDGACGGDDGARSGDDGAHGDDDGACGADDGACGGDDRAHGGNGGARGGDDRARRGGDKTCGVNGAYPQDFSSLSLEHSSLSSTGCSVK